jgi:hypothetical protein
VLSLAKRLSVIDISKAVFGASTNSLLTMLDALLRQPPYSHDQSMGANWFDEQRRVMALQQPTPYRISSRTSPMLVPSLVAEYIVVITVKPRQQTAK